MNRACAEIDLQVLQQNISRYRSQLAATVGLVGVVKADAYGHGAVRVAQALAVNGIHYFAVAWLAEAAELRKAAITDPILILSQPPLEYISHIIEYDLVQTVYHYQFAQALSVAAVAAGKKVKVHLKVDTGMSRIGVAVSELDALYAAVKALPNIEIEGLFTHFASADMVDSAQNKKQIELFSALASRYRSQVKYVHAANSAAITNFPHMHFDLVRLGIELYRGVMTFKSQVLFVKEVSAGVPISYNGTYVTTKNTRVVTVSVGYADGFSRALSNKGSVLIQGIRCPIIGNICMDMCMVDGSALKTVMVGDEVVLIGCQGADCISAHEVAELTGTIDYEIMCGISKRVPRLYKE